jgi:hypothetical protein
MRRRELWGWAQTLCGILAIFIRKMGRKPKIELGVETKLRMNKGLSGKGRALGFLYLHLPLLGEK